MCHGTLLEFLRKGEGQHLQLSGLVDAAAQIALGMRQLALEGYIHRDLAARNILINENLLYKVAGFRFARKLQGDEYTADTKEVIPVRWTAPEAIRSCRFTMKCDVWSFGILLTELFSKGKTPYSGMSNKGVLEEVQNGYRMERPNNCPKPVYDIMQKCWNSFPKNRPTFDHLHEEIEQYIIAASLTTNAN